MGISKSLTPLHEGIDLEFVEHREQRKLSARYKLDTVYAETVVHASLRGSFEDAVLELSSSRAVQTTRSVRIRPSTASYATEHTKLAFEDWQVFAILHDPESYAWRIYAWVDEDDADRLLSDQETGNSLLSTFVADLNLASIS